MCSSCVSNRRRFDLKKKAVKYLGGRCVDCGYEKCLEALEFDHIDPTKKEFSISGKHCKSWESIQTELDKCTLRCANCHRERHSRDRKILPYTKKISVIISVCATCKRKYNHQLAEKRKYCSTKCAGELSRKISWPDIDALIDSIRDSSFTNVANKLGVSDNAIRKHLIKHGTDPKAVRSVKDNKFTRL